MNTPSYCVMEFPNTVSPLLCDDIINLYNEKKGGVSVFIIPKKNKEWEKIEKYLYKQMLVKLTSYKTQLLYNLDNDYVFKLNSLLEKNVYCKDFFIQKYCPEYRKTYSRYNVLSFLFFLEDTPPTTGGTIEPKKGKLLIFPEEPGFRCEFNYNDGRLILTGQLCGYM